MTTCRWEDIDGTPVRVRGDRPMTDADREALTAIVQAARAELVDEPEPITEANHLDHLPGFDG